MMNCLIELVYCFIYSYIAYLCTVIIRVSKCVTIEVRSVLKSNDEFSHHARDNNTLNTHTL